MVCLDLLLFKLLLESSDVGIILEELLLIVHFANLESLKSSLLCFVEVVIEDDDRLVLANGMTHVADAVLSLVAAAQLFLVLRALVTHAGPASVAVVPRGFEGAKRLRAICARVALDLDDLLVVEGLGQYVRDQVLNYAESLLPQAYMWPPRLSSRLALFSHPPSIGFLWLIPAALPCSPFC